MPTNSASVLHKAELVLPLELSEDRLQHGLHPHSPPRKLSLHHPAPAQPSNANGQQPNSTPPVTFGDMLAIGGNGAKPRQQHPQHRTAAPSSSVHNNDTSAIVHLPPLPPRPSDAFLTSIDADGNGGNSAAEPDMAARELAKLRLKQNTVLKLLHNAGPTDDPVRLAKWNENAGAPNDRTAWTLLTTAAATHEKAKLETRRGPSREAQIVDERVAERMRAITSLLTSAQRSNTGEHGVPGTSATPPPFLLQSALSISRRSPPPQARANTTTPTPQRFVTSSRVAERTYPSGAEVHAQRRAKREAAAALEQLRHDPQTRRSDRDAQRLQELHDDMARVLAVLAEQEARQSASAAAASTGARRTAQTIMNEWRAAAEQVVETEESHERAQYDRQQRRLAREEREAQKRADAIALSIKLRAAGAKPGADPVASSGTEDKRELVRCWRVVRGSPVEVYSKPQLCAIPVAVLNGGELLEELSTEYRNDIVWVQTSLGWIAAQMAFNGIVRVQLSPEAQTQQTNIRDFLYDQLDDATEVIERALEACPPERLRGAGEVRELLLNAEMQRQRIRELPAGHADFIRQTWNAMQQRSRHQRRLLLEASKGKARANGEGRDRKSVV